MQPALLAFGLLLVLVGLVGLLLPAIPGSPLIFLGIVLVAWADAFTKIGVTTLVWLGLLALLAFAVDYVAGALGAKSFGASRWGIVGAAVGTVVGLFFGLPGLLLGPAVGAVAFEYWKDPDFKRAATAGAGVVIGYAAGIVLKCAIAFTMLGIAAAAYFTD